MRTPSADFRDHLLTEGTQFRFNVERGEQVSADRRNDTTFSAEALEIMTDHMQAWVLSRLIRHSQACRAVPEKFHITVRMETDVATGIDHLLGDLAFDWTSDTRARSDTQMAMHSRESIIDMRQRILGWIQNRLAGVSILSEGKSAMPQSMELIIDCEGA
jgi:hypothetical protein